MNDSRETPKSGVERRHRPRGKAIADLVRQLNTRTGIIVDKYLARVFEEQGFQFDPERENRSVYNPDKLFDALHTYSRRDTSYDRAALDKAKAATWRAFGGQGGLAVAGLDEGLKPFVKLEKSSGLPLVETKGLAFEHDLALARSCLEEDRAFQPCVAYHRIQFGENGPKTRLVWGYPLSVTLIESRFARPLHDEFLRIESPMAFGYRKMELSAITSRLRNSGLTYCLDYSKFDSSINAEFVKFAFTVLRSHFGSFNAEEQRAWDRIVSYFIHTTILMPDGYVYQKHGGVPSGSYFTQLVDSVVNYLATQYMAVRATNKTIGMDWCFVLGDDSIFFLPAWVPLDRLATFGKELGLTVNAEKSVVAKGSEQVHFLGHLWPHGVASRDLGELIKRLVFSETPSSQPLPVLRAEKIASLRADCKEASRIAPIVNKARLRMLKKRILLHMASAPRTVDLSRSIGHFRSLESAGISTEIHSRKNELVGLWR